jgi:GWxTD domain-containing protein
MKKNLLAVAGIALLVASSATAALVKYKEWAKSPEFTFLATDDEIKAWKKVASDEEAEKFVALFWARRDPDLKTPGNEFQERFEALVKAANERFRIAAGKTSGAFTERGKLFILLGPAKYVDEVAGTKAHGYGFGAAPSSPAGSGEAPSMGMVGNAENAPGTTIGESQVTFTYEAQQLPEWAGVKPIKAIFAVEQTRDSIVSGEGDVRRVEKAAIKAALKNPQLTEAPTRAAAKAAPAPAPAPTISPAAAGALDAAIARAPFGSSDLLALTQPDGETRLMVQAYLEGEVPSAPLRTALLVRQKGGAEVVRAEEPATPRKVLNGYVVDRTLTLAPGDYEVAWIVLDAAGGTLLEARRNVIVPAPSAEFHASELMLAVTDMPADAKPDSPFVFAGRRYLSRGDGTVRTSDGLSYLVRLHGPGLDAATKKALLKPRVKIQPKGKKAMELPAAPDEPIAVTEGKNGQPPIVDIAGTIADANVGEYFKPGEYTITVTIEDAVRGTKLELSRPFTVVAPPK